VLPAVKDACHAIAEEFGVYDLQLDTVVLWTAPRSEAEAWLISGGHQLHKRYAGVYMGVGSNLMFLFPPSGQHQTARLLYTIAHELTHAMTCTLRVEAGLYDNENANPLGKVGSQSNAFEEGTAELLVHMFAERIEEYFGLDVLSASKPEILNPTTRAYRPQLAVTSILHGLITRQLMAEDRLTIAELPFLNVRQQLALAASPANCQGRRIAKQVVLVQNIPLANARTLTTSLLQMAASAARTEPKSLQAFIDQCWRLVDEAGIILEEDDRETSILLDQALQTV
jgi:hypothetical protein